MARLMEGSWHLMLANVTRVPPPPPCALEARSVCWPGAIHHARGDHAEAERHYLESLRLDPTHEDAKSNLRKVRGLLQTKKAP